MKETNLRALLDCLTNAARLLTVYPVYLFCFTGLLDRRGDPLWLYALATFVLSYAALVLTRVVQRRVRLALTLRLIQGAMLLVSLAVGIGLCLARSGFGWQTLYAALLPLVYGVLGCVFANARLRRFEFFVSAGVYIFIVIVLSWRGGGYPVNAFIVQFLLISVAFALEFNFLNIDFLMRRRGHQMSHLPARIRYFNLLLLAGILALVLVLVLARGVLMQGAGRVFGALYSVLLFVTGPLRRWWRDFDFKDHEFDIPEATWDETKEEDFLIDDDPGADAALQANLLIVVFAAAVIFLLVYFRRPIARGLRAFWTWLVNFLRSLLRSLGVRRRNFGLEENEYYTDTEEILDNSVRVAQSATALRAWRRELKAYQKMPDSREKYLYGYGLSVRGLQLHGVEVTPSDTPLEVLCKAERVLTGAGYDVATQCCNALAFGRPEEAPAPEWASLQQTLELLKSRKLGK